MPVLVPGATHTACWALFVTLVYGAREDGEEQQGEGEEVAQRRDRCNPVIYGGKRIKPEPPLRTHIIALAATGQRECGFQLSAGSTHQHIRH